jgi:putative transcriptional regulator
MHTTLKELRIKNKYTVRDMAKKLKISPSYYNLLEKGTRTLSYEMAKKIATIFKKKPDKIFYLDYK